MSSQPSVHVDNPELSTGAFDKHEDVIRAGISKISSILHTLSNSSQFRSLKSKLALEDQQITNLKVLRIVSKDHVNYDFYISFVIGEDEYHGEIKKMNSREPEFKSEVFKDTDLIQTKEWIIRIKGLIIKTLKKWLRPEEGVYKILKDEIICYSTELGNMVKIKKDEQVELVTTFENKIVIKYKDNYYNLVNDNFIYFNYWFIKD
jgi:hypothetical protein